ncbi:uncharacterized protein [Ptychodera flava]|uniref:uncharacterized protein isoform X2 n=1 Tax=Ptychodera flava TaxID=63121 RepID=UPI003969BE47
MANYLPEYEPQMIGHQEQGIPEPYRQFKFEDSADQGCVLNAFLQLQGLREELDQLSGKVDLCLSSLRKHPSVAKHVDPALDGLPKRIRRGDGAGKFEGGDLKMLKDIGEDKEELTCDQWTKTDSIELQKVGHDTFCAQTLSISEEQIQYNKACAPERHGTVGDTGFAEASNFSTAVVRQAVPSISTPGINPVQEEQEHIVAAQIQQPASCAEQLAGAHPDSTSESDEVLEKVVGSDLKLTEDDLSLSEGSYTEGNESKTQVNNQGKAVVPARECGNPNPGKCPPTVPMSLLFMQQIYEQRERARPQKNIELETHESVDDDLQAENSVVIPKDTEEVPHDDQNTTFSESQSSKSESASDFSCEVSHSGSASSSKQSDNSFSDTSDGLSKSREGLDCTVVSDDHSGKCSPKRTDHGTSSASLPCSSAASGQSLTGQLSLQPVPRGRTVHRECQNQRSIRPMKRRKCYQIAVQFPPVQPSEQTDSSTQNVFEGRDAVSEQSGKSNTFCPVQPASLTPCIVTQDVKGKQLHKNGIARFEGAEGNGIRTETMKKIFKNPDVAGGQAALLTTIKVGDDNFQENEENLTSVNRNVNIAIPELSPTTRKVPHSITGIDCTGDVKHKQLYFNGLPASPDGRKDSEQGLECAEDDFKQRNRHESCESENIITAKQEACVDASAASTLIDRNETSASAAKPLPLPALPAYHPAFLQHRPKTNAPSRNLLAALSQRVGHFFMETMSACQVETEQQTLVAPATGNGTSQHKYPGVRVQVFYGQKLIATVAHLRSTNTVQEVYNLVRDKVRASTGYTDFLLMNQANGQPMDGGSDVGKGDIKALVLPNH